MQPTTTCPRRNRAGRYPFITPATFFESFTRLVALIQRAAFAAKSAPGERPQNFGMLSWHLLDDALCGPGPRITASPGYRQHPHLFQVNAVLRDDRLDSVHHHRRNGFGRDS